MRKSRFFATAKANRYQLVSSPVRTDLSRTHCNKGSPTKFPRDALSILIRGTKDDSCELIAHTVEIDNLYENFFVGVDFEVFFSCKSAGNYLLPRIDSIF